MIRDSRLANEGARVVDFCVVYLASPRLAAVGGVPRLTALLASLRSVRACLPESSPVLIFHEDYTEEDKDQIRAIVPSCEFHEVDFTIGDADFVRHRRPKGYMLMCRFWSGVVQQHPALQRFTHYMRLDDDSYFINPKLERRELVRMSGADYSFRQLFFDPSPEHSRLYAFTVDFLRQAGLVEPTHRLLAKGAYTGKAVYNNFHFASLRFWRHPLVGRFVEAVEAERGCLRCGWMDANLHTMILALLVPHTDLAVNQELHFGYRHNHHVAVWGSVAIRFDDQIHFVVRPEEYA